MQNSIQKHFLEQNYANTCQKNIKIGHYASKYNYNILF